MLLNKDVGRKTRLQLGHSMPCQNGWSYAMAESWHKHDMSVSIVFHINSISNGDAL